MQAGAQSEISEAVSSTDYAKAADLIRQYVWWCRQRYEAYPRLVDEAFSYQGLEAELSSLNDAYRPPAGLLLLARVGEESAGCVAFRTIGHLVCEMKRLFVRPEHHGLGLGRRLCAQLIETATSRGFRTMRLDTGDLLTEARMLYQSLGFVDAEPYYDCPPDLRKHLVFMERPLGR